MDQINFFNDVLEFLVKQASEESCDKKKDDNNFELPDETSMNNIDLGGILNLATEDTLNIRYLEILMDNTFLISRNFREFSGTSITFGHYL